MNLNNQQIRKLEAIISAAQSILADAKTAPSGNGKASTKAKRVRRSGKDLAAFRKMLIAERKKGVPVADLARKHSISSAYIYQL